MSMELVARWQQILSKLSMYIMDGEKYTSSLGDYLLQLARSKNVDYDNNK